jgi:hypothetical protein
VTHPKLLTVTVRAYQYKITTHKSAICWKYTKISIVGCMWRVIIVYWICPWNYLEALREDINWLWKKINNKPLACNKLVVLLLTTVLIISSWNCFCNREYNWISIKTISLNFNLLHEFEVACKYEEMCQ